MGTPLEKVYSAFLSKMLEDEWLNWTQEEVEEDLLTILDGALPWFKFPRKSLEHDEQYFFEELDNEFKESAYRKSRYFINKSNVSRTLITIVGEITFKRTYYVSNHSNKKFFYIDKIFDLPKKDRYDPIIKAIAISKAVSTSQAQSVRDT